jgi:hypothetical protein
LDPVATPSAAPVAGEALDVELSATITLTAELTCGFSDAVPDGTISNSELTFGVSNSDVSTQLVQSFVDDGTQSPTPLSPHQPTTFDFFETCGSAPGTCSDGTCTTDGTTSCVLDEDCEGTGPGISIPFLSRTNDPAVSGTTSITPSEPGVLRVTYEYESLKLPIVTDLVAVCIGGACVAGQDGLQCPDSERTGASNGNCAFATPEECTPDDSPRIMYDARCTKADFAEGTCSPFEDFGEAANICVRGQPGGAVAPDVETGVCGNCMPEGCGLEENPCDCDIEACCAFVQENYPTATANEFPALPVLEAGAGGSGGTGN